MPLLPLDQIASAPPWPAERTDALPGCFRAALIEGWAENVRRRVGADGLDAVRTLVPDAPLQVERKQWLPIPVQLRLTDAIVQTALGGDRSRLAPLIAEDVARNVNPAGRLALRTVGVKPIVRAAPRTYDKAYDVGRLRADHSRRESVLHFSGAAFLEHPTWQVLQMAAFLTLGDLSGRGVEVLGRAVPGQAFEIVVRYR